MHWFWLLLGYFVAQALAQVLGFISGFIIVRNVTPGDYALYTIVMTMGPVVTMLSDVGIGTGISGIGRKIWQDNERMGSLVQTALLMRRRFAILGFLVIGPVLFWMLVRNHATYLVSLLLLPMVFAGTWYQLTSSVMRMVVQLRQQIAFLRNQGLIVSVSRFVLIVLFAYCIFINVTLAILIGTFGFGLDAWLMTRQVKPQIQWHAPPNEEYRKTILSAVWRQAPLTVYFCIQSQVSIWLISIFGSAHQVADIGAATRIGMLFQFMGPLYSVVLVPRFARNNGRSRLRVQYWGIITSQLAIISVAVLFVMLFPQPFLWMLGPQYQHLGYLLWLVMLSSGINSFLGLTVGMNFCKGWIPPAWISIPLEVVTQIVLILLLDFSKTVNVVIFACLSSLPPIIFTMIYTMYNLAKEPEQVSS